MKLINARYEDICMGCAGKIKVGDLIAWEKKNSRHARCIEGFRGALFRNGN